MSKRPVSLSRSLSLSPSPPSLCLFSVLFSSVVPIVLVAAPLSSETSPRGGKKRKRWHAFSARCNASPARVACHLSDRGVTASTVEGTPLRHNGTDWAATDLSVCLSVKAVHQLSVTWTCLYVWLFGLLSVLFSAYKNSFRTINSVCRCLLIFTQPWIRLIFLVIALYLQ